MSTQSQKRRIAEKEDRKSKEHAESVSARLSQAMHWSPVEASDEAERDFSRLLDIPPRDEFDRYHHLKDIGMRGNCNPTYAQSMLSLMIGRETAAMDRVVLRFDVPKRKTASKNHLEKSACSR